MRAIAWGFYAPHHFKINSEVPYCIFVFPPLPLSVAWGCFTDSSSSRIFSLKYGTCVSRKYLLGRVSIFVALFFFFASSCVLPQIVFQKKKAKPNMGPKQSLSFFFPQAHFYLKSEKYLTFLKRYFFWQKKVVIFAKSAQCDKEKVYGLN